MYLKLKRIIDFTVSLTALVFLFPVFLVIAVAIKVDSKGPVFFQQTRIGRNKESFEMFKFRTMYIDTPQDTPTHLLEDPDQWITTTGKLLRKTSLDELPQLINIVKGDMSIVGPRPALWNQCDLIAERDKHGVNDVLPGLTGLAQVNGRDELPIEAKVQFDAVYVQQLGLRMDLKCFVLTFSRVLKSDGVVEGGTGALLRSKQTEPEGDLSK